MKALFANGNLSIIGLTSGLILGGFIYSNILYSPNIREMYICTTSVVALGLAGEFYGTLFGVY